MRIVHICSEAVPWAKTGGLADVAGALTPYLARNGHQVTLFLPLYRSVGDAGFEPGAPLLELGPAELGLPASAAIRPLEGPSGLQVRLVDAPALFDRDGLYGDSTGDYPDNLLRFAVFCRAALCALEQPPEILHCHDWQTALVPVLLRAGLPPGAGALSGELPASVMTIHNLAYQGRFPAEAWVDTGLPENWFRADRLEYYGGINLLKGGMIAADRVTTVSPTYAREIATSEFGFGLEGVIGALPRPVTGILNGIDTDTWNPAADSFLDDSYDVSDRTGKARLKQELLAEFGLEAEPDLPLFGFVSRLVDQKGLPLFEALADRFATWPARFVFLGSGERRYENLIEKLASDSPTVGSRVTFSERLAHLIEAGSDFFMMPSAFEPCGLNQMISQRYGTIPIVHRVGGLADSVIAATPESIAEGRATGIVFPRYDPEAFGAAIDSALALYDTPADMESVIRAGMVTDFSWDASGREYEQLYRAIETESNR
ncbi:MAG: glycogen synthase GlgA [marine benthic group bacterium]|nr:glycogen synthase GlgA [Gemmatimonadota bacterium]